jgi:hypothetical protein
MYTASGERCRHGGTALRAVPRRAAPEPVRLATVSSEGRGSVGYRTRDNILDRQAQD